ncbi:SDR family oxidoreductase [Rhodobacteraceae bacterium 2CG4]|uniref:SDR family oxidoreductase n=1 Tax=Halovulum marinum TaxID=2662447 RepID=A0A6L5YWG5_9RHOB|nr:SDR family oxidoreductase [Halovulum marinum]MSU88547.1 SDR family oxidoreductase [Halovulum marinum]
MAFSLDGKTVIVTGASQGVGLAIARRFSIHGARVMMTGTDEERLEAEAATLRKSEREVSHFAGDLREKLTVNNLIAATVDQFEGIDILINASREVRKSDPLDPDDTTFETLMDLNVRPTLHLSQAVARRMIKLAGPADEDRAGIGSIVNVTSIASRRTLPELMAYSVASAAVDQLTRSMAVAFAAHRIRVNAIALGSVLSASLQSALKDRRDLQDNLTAVTPLGRIGEADEAAEAAVFLASDSASFVTGQILAVDGGRTMLDPMDTPAH